MPTPFRGENHEPDLSFIEAAARAIAPVLRPGNLVLLESTSPVGATEQMAAWLAEARPDLTFPQSAGEASDIRVAYCPERVLPGRVMQELIHNDRVIGGMTPRCSRAAVALYRIFVAGEYGADKRDVVLGRLGQAGFSLIAEPETTAVRLKGCRQARRKGVVGRDSQRFVERLVGLQEARHVGFHDGLLHGQRRIMKLVGSRARHKAGG